MIAIVDYQMGNLRSVQKALETVGHEAIVTGDPRAVAAAEKIVLPGVGAMRDAMRELRQRNLIEPIRDSIAAGRPFLGICLGLQLLFEIGQEVQRHEGLGILPGEVVRFDLPAEYKVPHMGWNTLDVKRNAPILDGLPEHPYLYFVHSFHVVPTDTDVVAATTTYGEPFCSMIWRDRLFATQFHPEKSQSDGLRILRNFGDLA